MKQQRVSDLGKRLAQPDKYRTFLLGKRKAERAEFNRHIRKRIRLIA